MQLATAQIVPVRQIIQPVAATESIPIISGRRHLVRQLTDKLAATEGRTLFGPIPAPQSPAPNPGFLTPPATYDLLPTLPRSDYT